MKKAKSVGLTRTANKQTGAGAVLAPNALRIIERRHAVITMRRDGCLVEEIAKTLSIGIDTVRNDLKTVLAQAVTETQETVEEHRQLEIDRLDKLIQTYTPLAHGFEKLVEDKENKVRRPDGSVVNGQKLVLVPPDIQAANLLMSLSVQRRKLLALDVPEQKGATETGIREYIGIEIELV